MNEFGRPGGSAGAKIVHLRQADGIATACCIAGNTAAIDPATNDEDVENFWTKFPPGNRHALSSIVKPQIRKNENETNVKRN